MFSYLDTVNDFHWGFKPVFRYIANLTLIQLLLEKKNENQICIYILYLGHIEHRQNGRKVKKESTF